MTNLSKGREGLRGPHRKGVSRGRRDLAFAGSAVEERLSRTSPRGPDFSRPSGAPSQQDAWPVSSSSSLNRWSNGLGISRLRGRSVTGRRLDEPGSFEAGGPGTNGFRKDIGSFMLVGVGIPTAGCWELTARYRDAELTYVVLVEG